MNCDPTGSQTLLIHFYAREAGEDLFGRTLSSILKWDDEKLESCHDYIQYLFPLPEPSPYHSRAPVVDRYVFNAFREPQLGLQHRLRGSFQRMLWFYGFGLSQNVNGKPEIVPATHFYLSSRKWLRRFDHNHLRITRIIRSLRVLGLEEEALAFFEALEKYGGARQSIVSPKSLMFWTRAAMRPLYLAPEDEMKTSGSLDFLLEYEESKNAAAAGGERVTNSDTRENHFPLGTINNAGGERVENVLAGSENTMEIDDMLEMPNDCNPFTTSGFSTPPFPQPELANNHEPFTPSDSPIPLLHPKTPPNLESIFPVRQSPCTPILTPTPTYAKDQQQKSSLLAKSYFPRAKEDRTSPSPGEKRKICDT